MPGLLDDIMEKVKKAYSTKFDPSEAKADIKLNQAGSVMGSQKAGERETLENQGPLMYTLLNMLKGGGLDPTTAGGPSGGSLAGITPTAWKALAPEAKAKLTDFLNNKMVYGNQAGGESFFTRPFRTIGRERKYGNLNPEEYVDLAKNIPGYDRFINLVRSMTGKKLGPEFSGFRGQGDLDPLFSSPLMKQALPSATAVSTDPKVADSFAHWATTQGTPHTSGHVAKLNLTPEAIEGLLPTRGVAHGHEAELLVNPQKARDISLQASYPSLQLSGDEFPKQQPPSSMLQDIIDQVLQTYKGGGS